MSYSRQYICIYTYIWFIEWIEVREAAAKFKRFQRVCIDKVMNQSARRDLV